MGSLNNYLPILGVESPVQQGVGTKTYHDMSCFHNAGEQDESALKM